MCSIVISQQEREASGAIGKRLPIVHVNTNLQQIIILSAIPCAGQQGKGMSERQLTCSRDASGTASPYAPGRLCVGGLSQLALCRGGSARCPLHSQQSQSHADIAAKGENQEREWKVDDCMLFSYSAVGLAWRCNGCNFLVCMLGVYQSILSCCSLLRQAGSTLLHCVTVRHVASIDHMGVL